MIVNKEASAPSFKDQVTEESSVAVKVWTAVVFSEIDFVLVLSPALPDGPKMLGLIIPGVIWPAERVTSSEKPSRSVYEMIKLRKRPRSLSLIK